MKIGQEIQRCSMKFFKRFIKWLENKFTVGIDVRNEAAERDHEEWVKTFSGDDEIKNPYRFM